MLRTQQNADRDRDATTSSRMTRDATSTAARLRRRFTVRGPRTVRGRLLVELCDVGERTAVGPRRGRKDRRRERESPESGDDGNVNRCLASGLSVDMRLVVVAGPEVGSEVAAGLADESNALVLEQGPLDARVTERPASAEVAASADYSMGRNVVWAIVHRPANLAGTSDSS